MIFLGASTRQRSIKKIVYVAISVSENGYIVGANLISKYKIKEKIK